MTAYYIGLSATGVLAYLFFVGVVFTLMPSPRQTVDTEIAWLWPIASVVFIVGWTLTILFDVAVAVAHWPQWFERQVQRVRRARIPRARVRVENRRRP